MNQKSVAAAVGQRIQARLAAMDREQKLAVLTANCSCDEERQMVANFTDETITTLTANALAANESGAFVGTTAASSTSSFKQSGGEGEEDEYDKTGVVERHDRVKNDRGDDDDDEDYDDDDDDEDEDDEEGHTRNAAKKPTLKAWLKKTKAPREVRDLIANGQAAEERERQGMIAALTANVQNLQRRKEIAAKLSRKSTPALRERLEMMGVPVGNSYAAPAFNSQPQFPHQQFNQVPTVITDPSQLPPTANDASLVLDPTRGGGIPMPAGYGAMPQSYAGAGAPVLGGGLVSNAATKSEPLPEATLNFSADGISDEGMSGSDKFARLIKQRGNGG